MLLDLSTLQGHGLHLNVPRLQKPLLLLDLSTLQRHVYIRGPELHLDVSTLKRPMLHVGVSEQYVELELLLELSTVQKPMLQPVVSTHWGLSPDLHCTWTDMSTHWCLCVSTLKRPVPFYSKVPA
jgi:hypothetical protein